MRMLAVGLAWLVLTSALLAVGTPAYGAAVFTEAFDSRNTSRWSWGSGATVTGGRLRLADTTSFSTVTTAMAYDLQSFDVEVVTRPAGAVVGVFATDGPRSIEWYLEGTLLLGYVDDVERVRLRWSESTMRWLRFAVTGTQVVFSTSADGGTWTARGSAPLNWRASSMQLGLAAGRWSGGATSPGVLLDNATLAAVSSTPTVTPAPSPTPTATPNPRGTSAGERHGWGTPFAGTEFTDPGEIWGEDWDIFFGPGYNGQGWQSYEAIDVRNGSLVITGNSEGLTGGVGYFGAMQQYGRWESRIRVPEGYGTYHPVALLWPTSGRWPQDGEIDYFETTGSADRSSFSLHHGGGNPHVTYIPIDRGWHTYAVEWTPTSITAYYDGREYYRTTNTAIFPRGPMWHSFQLDWMGVTGGPTTRMEVDWLRIYRLN